MNNAMKKFLLGGTLAALFLPGLALAVSDAYNTVTLTNSASFSVNGITVNVGSTAAPIASTTVSGTSFTVSLAPGSTIKLVAPNRNQMTLTGSSGFVTDGHCSLDASDYTLTASAFSATTTITVTPSTSLCGVTEAPAAAASTGAASGGGGGGGASYGLTGATTGTTQTTSNSSAVAALQAQLNALLAQIATLTGKATPNANAYLNANANASFKRNLAVGATGTDVKSLQVYLNAHGFPVAASGAGSPGNETTKFGKATKVALAKWQASVGISPASGNFGAKTRAYIAAHP